MALRRLAAFCVAGTVGVLSSVGAALPAPASTGSGGTAATSTGLSVAPSTPATGITTVNGVRIGRHATFDRIVVDLTGPIPTWSVRYVPQILQDGSGKALSMRGKAFLRITLHPAAGHDVSRAPLYASFPTLREVRLAGDFEGYVSFGAGLSHKAPVHTFTLTAPNRLVVDISH